MKDFDMSFEIAQPFMLRSPFLIRPSSLEPEPVVARIGRFRNAREMTVHMLLSQWTRHSVWHVKHRTDTCHKKHRSTLFMCDDHVMVVMTPFLRARKRRRNDAILSSERKLSRERSLL